MSRLYALWGQRSGQWLTCGGLIITHTSRVELEFLFPSNRSANQPIVRPLPRGTTPQERIPLRFVPGLEALRFPLRREDFNAQT